MANDKKYQVFISSTYEDLKEERVYAMNAVLQEGHIPIGMELFHASDETQWELIKKRIEESDYYILIIAKAYGSMDRDISYTEKEYDYALNIGVPIIRFVIHKDVKNWNNDFIDSGVKSKRLEKFIKKATTNKQTAYWKNKDELNSQIKSALRDLIQIKPRRGWVRADETDYKNVANELARLSEENTRLKELVGKDDEIIKQKIEDLYLSIKNIRYRSLASEYMLKHDLILKYKDGIPLLDYFKSLSKYIYSEKNEHQICAYISTNLYQIQPTDFDFNELKDLLITLESYGLLESVAIQNSNIIYMHDAWKLTLLGKKFNAYLKSVSDGSDSSRLRRD